MKAEQFLRQGADVLAERGKEYDKPEGERSMARCVAAFNAITGKELTEAEGWLLLQVLKDVRQWQNPGRYHEDSAVDCEREYQLACFVASAHCFHPVQRWFQMAAFENEPATWRHPLYAWPS